MIKKNRKSLIVSIVIGIILTTIIWGYKQHQETTKTMANVKMITSGDAQSTIYIACSTWDTEKYYKNITINIVIYDTTVGNLAPKDLEYSWFADGAPSYSNKVSYAEMANGQVLYQITLDSANTGTMRLATRYTSPNGAQFLWMSEDTIKVDKTAPTVGTISMTLDSENGTSYTGETWTNKSVYIKLTNNGSDAESGLAKTEYSIKKNGISHVPETTLLSILSPEGEEATYTIVVKTTDNVGNTSSKTYTAKIDMKGPEINCIGTTVTRRYKLRIWNMEQ